MSSLKLLTLSSAAALLVPLLGTTLGAAMVFFMKNQVNERLEKLLLGFAAGVMIAASVWSLLIPALDMAKDQGEASWLPALLGFALGIAFLLLIDSLVPHLHLDSDQPEGLKSGFSKTTMMLLAVTIHNIPEGMAVGVTLAGALTEGTQITLASAMALSLGIAIQNFPEGAIVSMPLESEGMGRKKAFVCGFLSGAVEPAGAFITIVLTSLVLPLLPYFLSFAAGAMFYVVVEELIPEAQTGSHSNIGTVGAAVGFCLMMVLDVALG